LEAGAPLTLTGPLPEVSQGDVETQTFYIPVDASVSAITGTVDGDAGDMTFELRGPGTYDVSEAGIVLARTR